MADISQIKLPNGDTFDLVDEKSGYITLPDLPVYDGTVEGGDASGYDPGYRYTVSQETVVNETVTTESSASNYASLSSQVEVNSDTIIVTYDGQTYECNKHNNVAGAYYGAELESDFSDFPFTIFLDGVDNGIYTSTSGTHTIEVKTVEYETTTTSHFKAAVDSVVLNNRQNFSVSETSSVDGSYEIYTLDKTLKQIKDYYNTGVPVIIVNMSALATRFIIGCTNSQVFAVTLEGSNQGNLSTYYWRYDVDSLENGYPFHREINGVS